MVTRLLEKPLHEHIAVAERHASRLGARVSQLGGAITAEPTRFVERSQVGNVDVPSDTSDPAAVLAYPLAQEQKIIGRYGQLIDQVRGADAVTERLLVSILATRSPRRTRSSQASRPTNPPRDPGAPDEPDGRHFLAVCCDITG
jgi:ferritin-like protein